MEKPAMPAATQSNPKLGRNVMPRYRGTSADIAATNNGVRRALFVRDDGQHHRADYAQMTNMPPTRPASSDGDAARPQNAFDLGQQRIEHAHGDEDDEQYEAEGLVFEQARHRPQRQVLLLGSGPGGMGGRSLVSAMAITAHTRGDDGVYHKHFGDCDLIGAAFQRVSSPAESMSIGESTIGMMNPRYCASVKSPAAVARSDTGNQLAGTLVEMLSRNGWDAAMQNWQMSATVKSAAKTARSAPNTAVPAAPMISERR